jgi:hypothetical protein
LINRTDHKLSGRPNYWRHQLLFLAFLIIAVTNLERKLNYQIFNQLFYQRLPIMLEKYAKTFKFSSKKQFNGLTVTTGPASLNLPTNVQWQPIRLWAAGRFAG